MVRKITKGRAARRAVLAVRATEKPISNRQRIRQEIDAKGDDAARALGKKLKMSVATIEAYIKGWARIKGTSAGGVQRSAGIEKAPGSAALWFRFETRAKARSWADHRAASSGLVAQAFKITEEKLPEQVPPDDPQRLKKWQPKKPKFAVEADKDFIAKAGKMTYLPSARKALGLDKDEKPAKKAKPKVSDVTNISMSEMFGDDLRKPSKKPEAKKPKAKKKGARA